jgi:hypothetical protein
MKDRITIDIPSYFHNKNFGKFARPKQCYLPIATTVSMNMEDQDGTSKIRTGTRRVEYNEDNTDTDKINIRKYFEPTIYRMLLNPRTRSKK